MGKKSIPTHYYISPQIWAWKKIASLTSKDVDKMYVILPFEKHFMKTNIIFRSSLWSPSRCDTHHNSRFNKFRIENQLDDKPIIALLPGSRKQEITKMLAVMLSIVEDFPDYQFVIAGAQVRSFPFESFITNKNIKFISNKTYDLLKIATAALVTSGTATLETALFKVPEVVVL
jgi:lipid-A-disaccharide synthase